MYAFVLGLSISLVGQQPILHSLSSNLATTEVRWDWNAIDPVNNPINLANLEFPGNFLWGVATSGHQVDGDCNCQWISFEGKKDWWGNSLIEQSGVACKHWNRYKEDIKLMQNIGVQSYRFSIEWSKIEPIEGVFDQAAIDHYHDLIDTLLENNIIPMITLHHFTHPQWFEEKGAFEQEENNRYFVRYCTKMFGEFAHKVPFWCTFNEPGVYAFQGYIHSAFPPAKKSVLLAGVVSKNMIIAHIDAYKAMKKMPHGASARIGITHSITMFDPYHTTGILSTVETWLCSALNHAFYDAMLQFFVTGKFHYRTPKILGLFLNGNPCMLLVKPVYALFPLKTEFYSEVFWDYAAREGKSYQASDILDFFGVQPYSHSLVDITNTKAKTHPTLRAGDIATDMPYCIYPEIIERAVNVASKIGVPLYITENGIADKDDSRRELFIRRHLYVLSKVIEQGYDVRGYFYWSLLDNFEWNMGYDQKFGLYSVDFITQKRTLTKGGAYYQAFLADQKNRHALNAL